MPSASFAAELEQFGPGTARAAVSSARARAYCRRLARTHYENFTVASWLVPRSVRQDFYHIYAYCRWSDDLADETGDPALSLELLSWWRRQLDECYHGRASHPVFVALAETIHRYHIPPEPFRDLLVAFRQDQRTTRYETFEDLLGYCRNSANPVGRLVLYLGRSANGDTAPLSDSVCTGLQLANFWQDVARDWRAGRIYLPLVDCRRFGYSQDDFASGQATEAFRRLLAYQVERAESYLIAGWPLVSLVPRWRGLEIRLFISGGLEILSAIRRRRYDVWSARPTVSKLAKARLVAAAWPQSRFGAAGGPA